MQTVERLRKKHCEHGAMEDVTKNDVFQKIIL
jgi:hypothetical protein